MSPLWLFDSIRKERVEASGLLSRSGRQSVSPFEFGVFRSCPSLSLSSILFATTVCCPDRAPTKEMPGHLAPAFHLFEPCLSGVKPARRLGSRQQSSIQTSLEGPDQPCQPSLCNEVCRSIDGRRQHLQWPTTIVPLLRRKRFFLDVLCSLHIMPICEASG